MFGTVSIPPPKMRQRHRKKVLVAVNKPDGTTFTALVHTRKHTHTHHDDTTGPEARGVHAG